VLLLVSAAWFVVLVQVIYLGRYLFAFRDTPSGTAIAHPPVSVVVCAHDEEANLRHLIPLLLEQDYPEFEVIVVEDRCNDGTYDYLLEATRQHPRLKMVRVKFLPEHVTGKKYAITLGVKAALHDWVLLTDADCRPAGSQWIRLMAAHMSPERQIVVGYSPYLREPGYLNSFIRFESLITATQFMGRALLGSPYMGTGRNLAYRKALFLDNKGFNGHLAVTGGDDDLFVNRHATSANTAACLGMDSITRSIPERTWASFLHQKKRHLSVGKHYRRRDRWKLGLFSMTWILSWALLPVMLLPVGLASGAWVAFVVRVLLLSALVHRASRKMGEPFEAWKTPLLDFNYAIYYLGTGLSALASKRIRWKN
jgi:glycosyltransferase involved in cell wall biosynthesis